jgi:hypothetical protein
VIAAEDAHELGILVADDVLALPDRVGRAAVPRLARALLRRDRLDELVEDRRQAPRTSDVLLYCVSTLILLSPELTKLDSTMSMIR